MAAPKLKEILNPAAVRQIASEFAEADPSFNSRAFLRDVLPGLEALELSPRARHIADALWKHLPKPFARASRVLLAALAAADKHPGNSALRFMPHGSLIQHYGLEDLESSLQAQYELTQRFTAEWSIRPFLETYPEQTYARLLEWALDPSEHVRRLVSEGTRPRLPWASRLKSFQENPQLGLRLLDLLKDDPSLYVRRSVANHLNDIAKDHPSLAVSTCQQWMKQPSPARAWIVKHALRSLVKQGHPAALALLGAGKRPQIRVSGATVNPAKLRVGGEARVRFALESLSSRRQDLIVDYAVHYAKANGETRPKVFKLRRVLLEARQEISFEFKISFRDLTTRKHYPGRHHIDLLVNGQRYSLTTFSVLAA
jgi:3-methyladenine DNA glycosylase AlkC